jgi:hypothetical protein
MKKKFLRLGVLIGLLVIATGMYAATQGIGILRALTGDRPNDDSVLACTMNMVAYQIYAADANTKYTRYQGGDGPVFIKKETITTTPGGISITTNEKTFAPWSTCTTASYIGINDWQ